MLVNYQAEIFCADTYSDITKALSLRTGILLKYQTEIFLFTRIVTVQNHRGLLAITAGRNPFLLTPIVTLQNQITELRTGMLLNYQADIFCTDTYDDRTKALN